MFYQKIVKRRTYPTRCKYCKKHVFYHENEHGSRVFFESLGSPWHVHLCLEYLKRRFTSKKQRR